MAASKKTVLITGCSDNSLGAALAIAFHKAGLHVYASARNPTKMTEVAAAGIETLTLDVQSESSIAACVDQISKSTSGSGLDILVNNAGAGYTMPFADLSLDEAKKLFDINVWSYLAVTQAFLPLVLKARGIVVNHTSAATIAAIPAQAAYNASKAAMAMFSATAKLELEEFGVRVVDLKSGLVRSNIVGKTNEAARKLPEGSIYAPAKEEMERVLRTEEWVGKGEEASKWAKNVVADLLRTNPPPVIWRGEGAGSARVLSTLPNGMMDGWMKGSLGFDKVEKKLRQ